ncbi:TlpA family protein disulfide reductase [Thauera butanivorans]|uniref:TlpA family protein disulfide reductase n=1 Tax=Thauera butanivorans TaxID=86174 RepID=UPI000837C354|nr:TlpA disulfide reductase family protein [Thauera butanivorans]
MRAFPIALACALLAACGSPDTGPSTGTPAPRFEAVGIDGSVRRFPEDFAGTPVILDFWADWCRYCAGGMARIDAVHREHAARGLAVVAVNVGQDRDTAAAFIDRLGVGYSAVLDPDSKIARRYGVNGLPITYFIDRDGIVGGKIIGEADRKSLMFQLNRILPPAP